MRNVSFDYLLRMDLSFINKSKSGSVQNFVSGYPSRIGLVMGFLGNLISNFALLIIYTGHDDADQLQAHGDVARVHGRRVLSAASYLIRSAQAGGRDVTKAGENMGQVVYEAIGGMSLIRLSVAEDRISARHRVTTELLRSAQNRFALANALIIPLFIATSGA